MNSMGKNRISRMINETIPNKLLNTYLDIVQDWLVVRWQIGKYKVCSKCGEAKLANERYFSPDIRNKDGLYSICKKCFYDYIKMREKNSVKSIYNEGI